MPPLAEGKRSRAILGADERRREVRRSGTFLKSASSPFSTHPSHRHCAASESFVSRCLVLQSENAFAWRWAANLKATYLHRQLASRLLWHIVGGLQEQNVSAWTLKINKTCIVRALSIIFTSSFCFDLLQEVEYRLRCRLLTSENVSNCVC